MCSVLDPSTGGHSKSSRSSTTWPVGWGWERRRWWALDGRYGDASSASVAVSASVVASAVGRQSTDTPLFSLGLLRRRRGTDCIDPGLRNQLRPAQLRDAVATPNSRSAVKRLVLRWGANALQRREEATLSDLSTLWRRSRRQTRPIHQRATRARRRTAAGQGLPSDNGAGRIPARPDPP